MKSTASPFFTARLFGCGRCRGGRAWSMQRAGRARLTVANAETRRGTARSRLRTSEEKPRTWLVEDLRIELLRAVHRANRRRGGEHVPLLWHGYRPMAGQLPTGCGRPQVPPQTSTMVGPCMYCLKALLVNAPAIQFTRTLAPFEKRFFLQGGTGRETPIWAMVLTQPLSYGCASHPTGCWPGNWLLCVQMRCDAFRSSSHGNSTGTHHTVPRHPTPPMHSEV